MTKISNDEYVKLLNNMDADERTLHFAAKLESYDTRLQEGDGFLKKNDEQHYKVMRILDKVASKLEPEESYKRFKNNWKKRTEDIENEIIKKGRVFSSLKNMFVPVAATFMIWLSMMTALKVFT